MQDRLLVELKEIKKDLEYIKEHKVDRDMILTKEEEERREESLGDFKKGRTTSLRDFEKEMKNHICNEIHNRTC